MQRFVAFVIVFAFAVSPAGTSVPLQRRALTLQQRVAAQRAIEEVYWRHRLWPDGNRAAKPPLGAVLPDGSLLARVEDYLARSTALEVRTGQPVSARQLQSEMDRIVRDSRDPAMLQEILDALGRDPYVVAECLARPALVERMTRGWYGRDESVPRELRRSASARGRIPHLEPPDASYVLGLPAGGCAPESWTPTRLDHPIATESSVAVWTGSELLSFGQIGIGTAAQLQGGRYDPLTDTWAEISRVGAPSGATGATAVWTGREMIVWGGRNGFGPSTNAGARYDPATDSWAPTSVTRAPSARYSHTSVWTGTEMMVWGGVSANGLSADGFRYDPESDTWAPIAKIAGPSARIGHSAVWTGREMIVWGGTGSSGAALGTGGRYDPATRSWTPTSLAGAPTGRREHAGVWTGTQMIVWGGSAPSNSPDPNPISGGRYDPVTDTWIPTTLVGAPIRRVVSAAVWSGREMIVWGGTLQAAASGGRYDPVADTWTPTSTVDAPASPRYGHVAVWTGAAMLVWGGTDGTSYGGSIGLTDGSMGGLYDPESDSWTPAGNGTAPSWRKVHSAVWTGAEMIVFGGKTLLYPTRSGSRYDPALDRWTPIALAPVARAQHTAVWTGTEMIVWGGTSDGSTIADRYDPLSDTWTSSTPAGPADPRRTLGHAAVWTGSEMLVWGGAGRTSPPAPTEYVNSGARYDPNTDSWTPTSTTLAPTPRLSAAFVWTGSELIIWGGYDASGTVGTGGRYDPTTDTWLPISTAGAPENRLRPAIWTGHEMILWGGLSSPPQMTGGRYDPATDSWPSMSTAGAPMARTNQTAVWTGLEMIVWGGYDAASLGTMTDTGGRYDPEGDTWVPTPLDPVAGPRTFHTAVWTGRSMVVWGGVPPGVSTATATGAVYCACPSGNCEPPGGHELRGAEIGSGREQLGDLESESRDHVFSVEHVRTTQNARGER